jgi:hypothetical protein
VSALLEAASPAADFLKIVAQLSPAQRAVLKGLRPVDPEAGDPSALYMLRYAPSTSLQSCWSLWRRKLIPDAYGRSGADAILRSYTLFTSLTPLGVRVMRAVQGDAG